MRSCCRLASSLSMTSIFNPIDTPKQAVRKRCFDPVVDDQTCLLLLGSLPGEKSLELQEYYGNRQNRFWLLISEVTGIDFLPLDYASRLQALLQQRIGLWDVVAEAHRAGSLDSHIRNRNDNDLLGLLARLPNLTTIAFNGGTAAKIGLKVLGEQASRYRIYQLPSSSPAYTLPYSEKLVAWQKLSK